MNHGWLTSSRKPSSISSRSAISWSSRHASRGPLLRVLSMPALAVVVLEDEVDGLGLLAGAGRRNGHAEGVHAAGPGPVLVDRAALPSEEMDTASLARPSS